MKQEEYIKRAEENLFHVYNRFPVVFDHGQGVYLYDTDGKKYLDAGSGIGVMALGYGDPEYNCILHEQLERLIHSSNLYYTPQLAAASEAVTQVTGMDWVFFTNSGAEAIEGALKTAKKHAYLKNPKAGQKIIAMKHSFHGRTVGALSVTGTEHYRTPFYPLMDGVCYAEFNNLESVKNQLEEGVCAIILETVQGEGGIIPASRDFLRGIRRICDERGILMIVDEIQCGMGRSGRMFAYQDYGIRPDILTTAKALGLGLPVGAFCVSQDLAQTSLVPGDHGTTYGGNPLACAAVTASIRLMRQRRIPEHVTALSPYFEAILQGMADRYDFISSYRGIGFMRGLVTTLEPGQVAARALEEGLVILTAGRDVIRMLPPLIFQERDFDELEEKLIRVFDSFR